MLDKIVDAFRTGEGVGWHEHDRDAVPWNGTVLPPRLHCQPDQPVGSLARRCEAKLEPGRSVADVGCGQARPP